MPLLSLQVSENIISYGEELRKGLNFFYVCRYFSVVLGHPDFSVTISSSGIFWVSAAFLCKSYSTLTSEDRVRTHGTENLETSSTAPHHFLGMKSARVKRACVARDQSAGLGVCVTIWVKRVKVSPKRGKRAFSSCISFSPVSLRNRVVAFTQGLITQIRKVE